MNGSMIPLPGNAQVWIDFDGTITQQDVLDELIRRYAGDDSWKAVEQLWQEGAIGSRECLTRQLACVRLPDSEIETFLASIQLDPGLIPLIELLESNQVPVAVLSDGLDRFIGPLLRRAGLAKLSFRSNSFQRLSDILQLVCPHGSDTCESASAHCKCKSIARLTASDRQGIYIGDGRSDLCPSRKVACRFAKGVLAMNLQREGISFLPFDTLTDVATLLQTAWQS